MKENKKIITILIVIAFIIVASILLIGISKNSTNNNLDDNEQGINLEEGYANNIELSNRLELIFQNIEQIDESYVLTMLAKNNTDGIIDLTNYRISFQDSDSNELEWFRGTAIGIVNPNEEVLFTIEINKNIKNIFKIVYSEFDYLN